VTATHRARSPSHWRKVGTWDTVAEGDRRTCVTCGTAVRSYRYRIHPPESAMFERCAGLAWCSRGRVYVGTMVHVLRTQGLTDALAALPREQREPLVRSEARLVEFLDRRAGGGRETLS
jgi:hypothetical protein